MLKAKQYAWKMDTGAEGYCCVFVYITGDNVETRLHVENPNVAIAFQKLLIEADYQCNHNHKIQMAPAWAR